MNENREGDERCRTFKLKIGPVRLNFNPVVTLLSACIIWLFVAICMAFPEESLKQMNICKAWVTKTFTWFFIGNVNIWLVFIVIVYFSKYGNLKLGKDDDKPEFNDATYFTMLFAAGIGVGFFYFGVAEPIYHYEPGEYGNRYWGKYSDNQRAQDAINITLFHWGLHGWVVYCIVGLALGLVSHRQGLPMTIRSCFYPLLGDRIFGWMGDLFDIVSIVSTMFGVCASLGAGAMTMNSGLNQVSRSIEENITNQTIIIWAITFFATMSVISGLKIGIRRLSEICFGLGIFLMLVILFYDNTFFLLNVFVQSVGYYFQNLVQLGFHTDAYAQVGNAPDGKESSDWMYNWTIAYWGWWISWSPFVGMFIAKISRGRTVKNFINSTLTAPIIFTFLWFTFVGGAGINMERKAILKGITCSSPLGGTNATEPYEHLFRLTCRSQPQMYFDLIQQYGDSLGTFLRIVSMASILLYFVTSSDSGSLVIDCLSANGNPDPPIVQRVFWALTEGACATALITAGGSKSLSALLAAAVTSGLPYTPVLSLMCVSIWKVLKMEYGDISDDDKEFSSSLAEIIDVPSWGNLLRVVVSVIAPWLPVSRVAAKLYNKHPRRYMVVTATVFYSWVILLFLEISGLEEDLSKLGWVMLCGFFAYLTGIRSAVRERFDIPGNLFEDALAVVFLYPLAVDQLDKQMAIEEQQKKDDPQLPDNYCNDQPKALVDSRLSRSSSQEHFVTTTFV